MSNMRKVLNTIGVKPDIFGLFEQGKTIAQYKNISKNALEFIYSMAFERLKANQIDEAKDYLFYLCINDHHDFRYLNALGVCFMREKEFDLGLKLFEAANLVNKNPEILINMAYCFNGLGNTKQSHKCLKEVIDWKDHLNQYAYLKKEAKRFLKP